MIVKDSFPFRWQHYTCDCGLAAIKMLAAYYHIPFRVSYTTFTNTTIINEGLSVGEIIHISNCIGFVCNAIFCTFDILNKEIELPIVAYYRHHHYVVIYGFTIDSVKIADPAVGKVQISIMDFCRKWLIKNDMGIIITYKISYDGRKSSGVTISSIAQ